MKNVHGLNGELTQPDWPPLTVREVALVLAAYPGVGGFAPSGFSSPRPFSAAATGTSEKAGELFIKRHSVAVRPIGTLEEEHWFMYDLHRRGLRVPRVLRTAEGESVHYFGGWAYEVHTALIGRDVYGDTPSWTPPNSIDHARSLGRTLARLHNLAEDHHGPVRKTRFLVADDAIFRSADPIAAIADRAAAWPELGAALQGRPWQEDIARVLLPWHRGERRDPPLWTHNDLHVSNLLWAGNHVRGIFDFGLSNRTSAVFDLATTLERNAIAWLRMGETEEITRPDIARALIAGYRELTPDTDEMAEVIVHLLPVVHAEFALSEMAYYEGILHSPDRTRIVYEDFLLGHAAWFATAQGRTFLDEVGSALT